MVAAATLNPNATANLNPMKERSKHGNRLSDRGCYQKPKAVGILTSFIFVFFQDPHVLRIAANHGRTPAQALSPNKDTD